MKVPAEKGRAAIVRCRERLVKTELATYKQSAERSDPLIYAAWRDAGYPHLDLITTWLNQREVDSAQVDANQLVDAFTPLLLSALQQNSCVRPCDSFALEMCPCGGNCIPYTNAAAPPNLMSYL